MNAAVLNVECSESRLQMRTAMLASAGLRVREARTGTEALRMAAGEPFDVALLPAALPDLQGVDVCRRLKSHAETRDAAVLLLLCASDADACRRIEALEAGASACLAEPLAPELLLAQITALVRDQGHRAAHAGVPAGEKRLGGGEEPIPPLRDAVVAWRDGAGMPELADIIDVVEVRALMNDFHRMIRIPMGLVDTKGHVLVGVGWQTICTEFHRVYPEACRHCVESDTELSAGIRPGEFRLYKCKNNMWDVATPIMVGDRHVGYVFSGQFFFDDEELDREVFRAQARRYGFDEDDYLTALGQVPRVPRALVNSAVAFFVRLARMLSHLGHSNIRLARSMAERDVLMHSLREREEQLRDAAGKLVEANRLKDQFLSTLSHELRTPLSAIVGWSQMLAAGTVQGDAARRAVDVIFRNAQAQSRLIDDVLDVSRIVTGKMRLDVRPVDVVPILGSALESVRLSAEARGIAVTTELGAVPTVVADSSRLQQVFWNLLSNAVKFTPEGGRIHVSVSCTACQIRVQVADSGIGINPRFLPHVFERFRQCDTSTTRAQAGLGLGLAIVQHLVELHGGCVEASSAGEGQGSVFTVVLPLHADSGNGMRMVDTREREDHPRRPALPDLRGVRVLVVDDDPDARGMLHAALAAAGAEVTAAASAGEALARLTFDAPDVMVSDIGMPECDGYELMRRLRDRDVKVTAIAVSGYGREEDRERALSAGFIRHLTKPVLPADLAAVVMASVGRTSHPTAKGTAGVPPGGLTQDG